MVTTCIIPCLIDGAPATTASYRFRAKWLAQYWQGADLYPNLSHRIADYDCYIFQKAYLSKRAQEIAHILRSQGKMIAFDITDPDWLQSEEHRRRLLHMLPVCDFAVVPTFALTHWLNIYLPTHVIPDRLDMADFTDRHAQRRGKPSCVWFGYSHNIGPLEQLWPTLERHGLYLTILSNELPEPWSYRPRVRFVQWSEQTANAEIVQHDVALVPPINTYKSNNRTLTAWALGLVTAETARELEHLIDYTNRRRLVGQVYGDAHTEGDVRLSVAEWQHLFEIYQEKRVRV